MGWISRRRRVPRHPHPWLDTHTADLDVDLASAAVLTVDGIPWPLAGWNGDPPGGHHRAETLEFDAGGPPTGVVHLEVAGLPAPLTMTWDEEELP